MPEPEPEQRFRAAVITVSTSRAAGEAADEGGPRLAAWAERAGAEVVRREVVSDDRERIAALLREIADGAEAELILTTGGTGFSPSDVTPEATRDVLERDAPGIGEAMRLASREHTRHWMISRGLAGTRARALIVNFPGNPGAIDEAGAAIEGSIAHVLGLLGSE